MVGASGNSSCKPKKSKKNISQLGSELPVLAFFSFSCRTGLKSNHKICSDPVSEGVAAFLRRLLSCGNHGMQAALQELFRGMPVAAHGKVLGGFCRSKNQNLIDS